MSVVNTRTACIRDFMILITCLFGPCTGFQPFFVRRQFTVGHYFIVGCNGDIAANESLTDIFAASPDTMMSVRVKGMEAPTGERSASRTM